MNPFTAIPNHVIEALARTRIAGTQRQVLDVIFRKTFGYGKERDTISASMIAEETGLSRNNVHRAINDLADRRIITALKNGDRKPLTLGINDDVTMWLPSKLSAESKASAIKTECRRQPMSSTALKTECRTPETALKTECSSALKTECTYPTDKEKKESKSIYIPKTALKTEGSELIQKLLRVSGRFHARQRRRYPNLIKARDVRDRIIPGVETLAKLIINDGHDFEKEVRPALLYALKDDFWGKQVRSLSSLRNKSRNGETKFRNLLASSMSSGPKKEARNVPSKKERQYTGTQADSHWLRSGGGGDGNVPEARAVSG